MALNRLRNDVVLLSFPRLKNVFLYYSLIITQQTTIVVIDMRPLLILFELIFKYFIYDLKV